jgi:hypothetical protein
MNRTLRVAGRQGRGDPYMHTKDGGHTFNGGIAFPIEEQDEPITTAEGASFWAAFSYCLLLSVAIIGFIAWSAA